MMTAMRGSVVVLLLIGAVAAGERRKFEGQPMPSISVLGKSQWVKRPLNLDTLLDRIDAAVRSER